MITPITVCNSLINIILTRLYANSLLFSHRVVFIPNSSVLLSSKQLLPRSAPPSRPPTKQRRGVTHTLLHCPWPWPLTSAGQLSLSAGACKRADVRLQFRVWSSRMFSQIFYFMQEVICCQKGPRKSSIRVNKILKVSSAHQECINLINNTVKLWHITI